MTRIRDVRSKRAGHQRLCPDVGSHLYGNAANSVPKVARFVAKVRIMPSLELFVPRFGHDRPVSLLAPSGVHHNFRPSRGVTP